MEAVLQVVQRINFYLSDYILVFLLIGTGLYFSVRTRFVQVRCFGEGMRSVFGRAVHDAAAAQAEGGAVLLSGADHRHRRSGGYRQHRRRLRSHSASAAREPSSGCGSSPSSAWPPSTPRRCWLRRPAGSPRTARVSGGPVYYIKRRLSGAGSASSSRASSAVATDSGAGLHGHHGAVQFHQRGLRRCLRYSRRGRSASWCAVLAAVLIFIGGMQRIGRGHGKAGARHGGAVSGGRTCGAGRAASATCPKPSGMIFRYAFRPQRHHRRQPRLCPENGGQPGRQARPVLQ